MAKLGVVDLIVEAASAENEDLLNNEKQNEFDSELAVFVNVRVCNSEL